MDRLHVEEKKCCSYKQLGDTAIIIQFGSEITPEIHAKVKAFTNVLEEKPFYGFIECVPAFTSVTVYYDPFLVLQNRKLSDGTTNTESVSQLVSSYLKGVTKKLLLEEVNQSRKIEIPVCYGGEYGPDLEAVASYHDLTVNEVIKIHSEKEYAVYMIGFAPGFPYLGGMSEKIATPRKSTPRLTIPEGAVGIAGKQTGIYPISTPGGWQIIGRTPYSLFNASKYPPSLLQSGDVIKFVPITTTEYENYKETSV